MKRKTSSHLVLLLAVLLITTTNLLFANDAIDTKVNTLLNKMTLEEKVGQMTQITLKALRKPRPEGARTVQLDMDKLREAIVEHHVGSILNTGGAANTVENWREIITTIQDMSLKETRLKIPNIYGIDAIHGANYIQEATLFPQSLAMACSWNTELLKSSAEITAAEIRAVGIPWNFNPVLGLGRQPLWSRLWETYGEDPYAASQFGRAYIEGLEGTNSDGSIASTKAAACMKHYLGYSFPLSGRDRTPAWIPQRMLHELFVAPFQAAAEAGVHTVMVNSSEINGIPVHSSPYYLTTLLRDELGFEGFVVSDWYDVINLYERENVAATPKDAVRQAVMAGMDMSMVPFDYSFYDHLIELVKEGSVPMARIDEAVGRILKVKFQLGLFENPYPVLDAIEVGSAASDDVSLQAARETILLLKNSNQILPLSRGTKVLVTGPTADSRASLNGGWSYVWQGNDESRYPEDKLTIRKAIEKLAGKDNTMYVPGVSITNVLNIDAAIKAAKNVDKIILCLGEGAYCETPGSINDLNIPTAQKQLAEAMFRTGKPVILVLSEGRPRIVTDIAQKSAAVVAAFLPGPQGGQAFADVLFGITNPSAKLAITYPRRANYLVPYDHKKSEEMGEDLDQRPFKPLWPFGHGLSYTSFTYEDLKLSKTKISVDEKLEVQVTVRNTGKRAGKEAVLLFLSDEVRSITPPVKQLKGFKKISLQPGESKTVSFELDSEALSFIGRNNKRITEPGQFIVSIGGQSARFELR